MAYTSVPINIKDAAGSTQAIQAYSDGTNSNFSQSLLDNTGALMNPANAANQLLAPIPTLTTSSAYAHTAVTTTYAYGQLWANNATAGSVTFGTVSPAKANNQAFTIVGGLLKKSGTGTANAIFRVHLFNAAPTTAVADYGAFAANLTLANWIGSLDCTTNVAGSDVSYGQLSNTIGAVNCNLPVSGAQTLYFAIEVRAAYTPVSAETLTLTLAVQ